MWNFRSNESETALSSIEPFPSPHKPSTPHEKPVSSLARGITIEAYLAELSLTSWNAYWERLKGITIEAYLVELSLIAWICLLGMVEGGIVATGITIEASLPNSVDMLIDSGNGYGKE
ncbi:hypothetical protein ACSQ67_001504 [Phaseolus vulgaris]